MPILLLGTSNQGKVAEFHRLLGALSIQLKSLHDIAEPAPVVEESASTYLGNATLKAVELARWSGAITLADDSGLEVDALGGRPGVHSARYANGRPDFGIAKLLGELSGVGLQQRQARFRCVLVVAKPDGEAISSEGSCEGKIATAPSGARGFGYDPIFVPDGSKTTFADLPDDLKDRLSHRSLACRALQPALLDFLHTAPSIRNRAR